MVWSTTAAVSGIAKTWLAYHRHTVVDVSVSGVVKADPERVFAYLADLANWPIWQSDMKTTELLEGEAGKAGARYRYVSKAMGQTIDSTVRLVKVDAPREVAFEGEWAGMIRPNGRYLVEPAAGGTRVTLNPHPATRGLGSLLAPLLATMIRRLNRQHIAALQEVFGPG
jgi:carbon monoxide dehydrogenase subunit G